MCDNITENNAKQKTLNDLSKPGILKTHDVCLQDRIIDETDPSMRRGLYIYIDNLEMKPVEQSALVNIFTKFNKIKNIINDILEHEEDDLVANEYDENVNLIKGEVIDLIILCNLWNTNIIDISYPDGYLGLPIVDFYCDISQRHVELSLRFS